MKTLPHRRLAQLEMEGQKLAASTMTYCDLDFEGDLSSKLDFGVLCKSLLKRIYLSGKTNYL